MKQEGSANNLNYFVNTFNYPTMAEAYRVSRTKWTQPFDMSWSTRFKPFDIYTQQFSLTGRQVAHSPNCGVKDLYDVAGQVTLASQRQSGLTPASAHAEGAAIWRCRCYVAGAHHQHNSFSVIGQSDCGESNFGRRMISRELPVAYPRWGAGGGGGFADVALGTDTGGSCRAPRL